MKIEIEGEPVSQARMKYSARGGFVRVYDPRDKEKKRIRERISVAFNGCDFVAHPRVSFVFHMPIPKSIPKRLVGNYNSGFLKHEKKPDVDNFIKLYLDCMDGICFEGDQKVSLGPCIKLYHPQPKTLISIHSSQELLDQQEIELVKTYILDEPES